MNVFKPYLRHKAVPFILRTDCQCLLWLLTTDHDLAIKKWLFQLTEFDLSIEHLRGKDNPSDLLSRQPLLVPQGYFGEAPIGTFTVITTPTLCSTSSLSLIHI